MKFNLTKIFFSLLFSAMLMWSCVESLTNSQTTTSNVPTIVINSPKSGDSVKVGNNVISYQASDATGGQGLSFYELYVNDKYVKRFEQGTDGTNPEISLFVDAKYIGTSISYMVKVYNKDNKSKESTKQENLYVRDSIPGVPQNLMINKPNDFAVNLLWDADSIKNEDGFELWRKDGGGGVYRKIKTMPPNTISTDDSGLSAFTDYFYKVRSYNESGPSDFSNEVSTSGISGGPWNLQAEAIGSSIVRLTWTDFALNELGFIIERTDPYTTNFQRISLAPRGATEYYDNSVTANTGYRYRVAYYTNSSVSGYSNETSISTYYTDVQGPTNLTATYSINSNLVILKWNDNSLVEKGTLIERKIGNGNFVEYATISPTDDDEIQASDSGVQRGQTYYYRIRQTLGSKTYTPYSNEAKVVIPN